MGEVYRADDLRVGASVALKFLPSCDFSRHPDRVARFTSEVRLARQITHPAVCRVFDIGEHDGRCYLSMEYIDRETVESLLRRVGRLPTEKVLDIARQLCAGLAAAHENGVLHRDLKPGNIMLDGRGNVHITDFGLAVSTQTRTAGEIAGTPAYMAPEQVIGRAINERTDLFSLRLILYELFTGMRVFQVATIEQRWQSREDAAAIVMSATGRAIDPQVETLIIQCLQKEAERRPASARAVAAALRRCPRPQPHCAGLDGLL